MTELTQSPRFYTKDHEWVSVQGDLATMGITRYAAEQLGDVVFVELPETGRTVAQGEELAVVESVKAASDIYAPVSGDVTEVNGALSEKPETVNESPQADGWICVIRLTRGEETESLMDEAAYLTYCEGL